MADTESEIRREPTSAVNVKTAPPEPLLFDIDDEPGNLALLLSSLTAHLDARAREIFTVRNLYAKEFTLRELGEQFGITHERIRQIDNRSQLTIAAALRTQQYGRVRFAAYELRRSLGSVFAPESPGAQQLWLRLLEDNAADEGFRDLLTWIAGYHTYEKGHYWHHTCGKTMVEETLKARTHEEPASIHSVRTVLEAIGVKGDVVPSLITIFDELTPFMDGYIWGRPTIEMACKLALKQTQRPMTPEEMMETTGLGRGLNSVKNALANSALFIKVDRHRYGLTEWGLEEYSGISDAIAKRIVETGGSARFSEMVPRIAQWAKVKESSVRLYGTAPRFVLKDDIIRLRGVTEPFEPSLAELPSRQSTFVYARHTVVLFQLGPEDVRGSGRPIYQDLAWALGARPNSRTVYEGANFTVSLSWPDSVPDRATLGGLRQAASAVGADVGGRIRLSFDVEDKTVSALRLSTRMLDEASPILRLQLLTGAHGNTVRDITRELRNALNTEHDDDLLAALIKRSDDEVAESLSSALASQ